jgi:hypothetical protein
MGETLNPYLADKHPGFPNAVEIPTAKAIAWQATIARAITDEESKLPSRHLIAQNIANFRLPVRPDDLAPGVSILNFHYAHPESVLWNRALTSAHEPPSTAAKPTDLSVGPTTKPTVHSYAIASDETGFQGRADTPYRLQAWNFVMAGGALFNHLDYSFTPAREDGTDTANTAPGGGSPALRRQLKILADFLHSFDLATLRPDTTLVLSSPGAVTRALGTPGQAYALYLEGRSPTTLTLNLPPGPWRAQWISPTTGALLLQRDLLAPENTPTLLPTPDFPAPGTIALRLTRLQSR